jgi:hypothetical protein
MRRRRRRELKKWNAALGENARRTHQIPRLPCFKNRPGIRGIFMHSDYRHMAIQAS